MLNPTKAFSSFSVDDIQKAKQFYSQTLGVEVNEENEYLLSLKVGGGQNIILYGKPNHEAATYTVLNFPVKNVEEVVDALIAKGIIFEQYNIPEIKTNSKGISHDEEMDMSIAWFKDPAGNIIAVMEEKA